MLPRSNRPSVVGFLLYLTFAQMLLFPGLARGGADQWTSVGPQGGTVSAVAVDPIPPSKVYAGTTGGVFRSANRGTTWEAASSGLAAAPVFALEIDPVSPSTLYAGTRGFGVFKSADGGTSWTAVNAGFSAPNVFTLAVNPGVPSTIYAGTNAGVFKSANGGASWIAANTGLGTPVVFALVIDPSAPATLYAGTNGNGVFRSTNGGMSWTAASDGLTFPRVFSLAVDPRSSATIFAGTLQGIFKSTNGAASWTATSLQAGMILDLAIDPVTPSTIYAGDGGFGVFRSRDGGQSWLPVNAGLRYGSNALAIDPSTPAMLYAGTQNGVFRSIDSGGSWTEASAGLTALKVFALAVVRDSPQTVFAGTEFGLFKSLDGGMTWTHLVNGLGEIRVFALALLPGPPRTICAGGDGGVFRSTDGGASWTHVVTVGWNSVLALARDPASSSTVYAGGIVGGTTPVGAIIKSTDSGLTWTSFGTSPTALPAVNALEVDPTSPSTVYAGTDAGAYKTDATSRWVTNNALASRRVFALALDPGSASTVYAGTNGGLHKSTNGGVSWTPVTNGLTATGIYALLFGPTSPSTFYAGTNGGVFKSVNGGSSWTAMNLGLTNLVVNAIAVARTSPPIPYAGTGGNSAFAFGGPEVCAAGPTTLCLNGSRFRLQVAWRAVNLGTSGVGQAVPLTSDTGYFWFFQSTNVELVIKVLDGRAINGKFWVFYGALSNVEYTITVTDSVTGEVRTYFNPQDTLASVADTSAFPVGGGSGSVADESEFAAHEREDIDARLLALAGVRSADSAGACTAGPTTLCLNGGRFRLEVGWRALDLGTSGVGRAVPLTADTGYFWFFQSTNVELIIKVLDGRVINGKFWVFYGALSNVEYTITVTDTMTGAFKTYFNPQNILASVADTSAF